MTIDNQERVADMFDDIVNWAEDGSRSIIIEGDKAKANRMLQQILFNAGRIQELLSD